MDVIIGRTHLSGAEQQQLRYALDARIDLLKKRSADDKKSHVHSDAEELQESCEYIAALLNPETHESTNTRRDQMDAFEGRESQPLSEVDREVHRESANAASKRRVERATAALALVLPPKPELELDDDQLTTLLSDTFDEVEYVSEGMGEDPVPHVIAGDGYWAGVRAGTVPALFIDIDPTTDWQAGAPQLVGETLVRAARRIWGGQETPEIAPVPELDTEGDETTPEAPIAEPAASEPDQTEENAGDDGLPWEDSTEEVTELVIEE